ncbi:MAG TPA: UrcA family protein [Rhizomicrobium sp.]|nr:UrcA family protein [Rhizomicrobium sp.]
MNFRHAITAFFISSVAAVALSAPALAAEKVQLAVHYDDLNLAKSAGAEVLVGRLRQAAQQVCGAAHVRTDLNTQAAYQACVRVSLNRAVADVGVPLVSDAYRQRFGKPLALAGN